MSKKSKIIISCLCVVVIILIGIIIYSGFSNKKTEVGNNNVNDNINNNVVDEDANKELFCEKKFEFDSKEFKYTLTKEIVNEDEERLVMRVYDNKEKMIFENEDNEVFGVSIPYENKEDYCLYNTIEMETFSKDSDYEYLIIKWITATEYINTFKVYSLKNDIYKEIIDLTEYSTTGYEDTTNNEMVDSFRIKDNKVYVISNDYKGHIEEMVYEFVNGTYNRYFTGKTNFKGVSGVA